MAESNTAEPSFLVSLISGGIAGTTVDVALYPLDTIKTRLQAPQGFLNAGGFRGVYKGLSAAAAGSAPGAALFFSTYEMSKQMLHNRNSSSSGYQIPQPAVHMIAASIGETVCCRNIRRRIPYNFPTLLFPSFVFMKLHS
jgi:solute carrier family 25 (mitochondrial S-adenosylmethionine transporter), member 26